jgi:hypothetical protein
LSPALVSSRLLIHKEVGELSIVGARGRSDGAYSDKQMQPIMTPTSHKR